MLQEAAALERNKTGENITVSDIVRRVIGQGLEQINHKYDRGPENLALSSLEHQVTVNAARDKVMNRGEQNVS
jgi:hypothetical protein